MKRLALIAAFWPVTGNAEEDVSLALVGPASSLEVPVTQLSVSDDAGTLWVTLDEEWAQPFGEFTAQNVTYAIAVTLCGETLSEPVIQAPIQTPVFPVTDAVSWVSDVLTGQADCSARP